MTATYVFRSMLRNLLPQAFGNWKMYPTRNSKKKVSPEYLVPKIFMLRNPRRMHFSPSVSNSCPFSGAVKLRVRSRSDNLINVDERSPPPRPQVFVCGRVCMCHFDVAVRAHAQRHEFGWRARARVNVRDRKLTDSCSTLVSLYTMSFFIGTFY